MFKDGATRTDAHLRDMSSRSRVLAVDDDPRGLLALALLLRAHGYIVDSVASGPEALRALEGDSYDVIIADEHMPGMSGSEMLAIARKLYPSTVRIVLTAGASVDSTIRSINEAGVFRYLTKPCPQPVLLGTVAEAVKLGTREVLYAQVMDSALTQSRLLMEAGEIASVGHKDQARPVQVSGFAPEELGRLSTREREVLEMVAGGRRVSDIANTLFISNHTVRNHLKAIFRKLDIHSQSEIVRRTRR
jgi:DNA-binding NarL/FixJ family response regulator